MKPQGKIRVLLRQPALPHYRVEIFKRLAARSEIDLIVSYDESSVIANSQPEGFESEIVFARKWKLPVIGEVSVDTGLGKSIRKHQPEVVILGWNIRDLSLWPLLVFLRLKGIGSVVWGHGYSKQDSSVRVYLRNWIAKKADSIMCYSNLIARKLPEQGIDFSSVFVAQNTLDHSENLAIAKFFLNNPSQADNIVKQYGMDDSKTWLVAVSRLDAANNFELLIRALPSLSSIGSVGVIIVGRGDDHIKRLFAIAEELGISDSVILTGAIYDPKIVGAIMSKSSLFCYPSNMGLSLHHAFAFGLPVVTGDDESLHGPEFEALQDGVNGALFSHDQLDSFCATVLRLLADKVLLQSMSQQAMQTASRHYTADNMVDGMVSAVLHASSGVQKA